MGALRRTIRIRRQDALVFRDRQGRMSVEGGLSVAKTLPVSRASSQQRQRQAACLPNSQISETDFMALQVTHSRALLPPLQTPRRFWDSSMMVYGSSGQSLAMFPEGRFADEQAQMTARDTALRMLPGGVLTRRWVANNCSTATSSSSRAPNRNIGTLTVLRSTFARARKLPVAISLCLNNFNNLKKVNAGQVDGPGIPIRNSASRRVSTALSADF